MTRVAERFSFVNFGNICSSCSINCCRRFYAVLLPEEEEEFKDVAFTISTERGEVKCIGSRSSKPCPFLDSRSLCTIYNKRPLDCRLWPIIVYIDFKTREKVVYLDMDCPAAKEGRIPREIIEKIVEEIKKLELNESWLEKYTLAPWPNNLVEITRYK
ncbi:MAG: YkgJ family cysteine cluster protein [Desulfurococcaceae archaeon]